MFLPGLTRDSNSKQCEFHEGVKGRNFLLESNKKK